MRPIKHKWLICFIVFQPNEMKWSLIGKISFHLLAYKSFQRSLISFGNVSNQTYWFFGHLGPDFRLKTRFFFEKINKNWKKQGFHEKVGQIWWVLHLIGGIGSKKIWKIWNEIFHRNSCWHEVLKVLLAWHWDS